MATTIESLTRGLPEEFNQYLMYCRNLKFEERPDYNYMRKIFKDLMYKRGHEYDYQYDWVLKKAGQKISEADYADAKNAGNIAALQGKDDAAVKKQGTHQKILEERKENRAHVGQQIANGTSSNQKQPMPPRNASAKKRLTEAPNPLYGR